MDFNFITLPYEAKNAPDLPSAKQILEKAAQEDMLEYGFVCFSDELFVRFDADLDFIEGHNLMFIRERALIKVPEVYAMFRDQESGYGFIIMERIGGDTLAEKWSELNAEEKDQVKDQVEEYIIELRKLQSPGYIGNLCMTPMTDSIICNWVGAEDNEELSGPFDSASKMMTAYIKSFENAGAKFADRDATVMEIQKAFDGTTAVFTHGELGPINLKRLPDGTLVLINWRFAGWRPASWEYCHAMALIEDSACNWPENGWGAVLEEALGEANAQWSQIQKLLNGLRY